MLCCVRDSPLSFFCSIIVTYVLLAAFSTARVFPHENSISGLVTFGRTGLGRVSGTATRKIEGYIELARDVEHGVSAL